MAHGSSAHRVTVRRLQHDGANLAGQAAFEHESIAEL
jgi:hypothetical protein